MIGTHHAWCGALFGAVASAAVPADFPGRVGVGLVMTVVAARSAYGKCSPDIDLKGEGICAHRRLFHWWVFLTGIAAVAGYLVVAYVPAGDLLWPLVLAVWAGWMAHLWGDFLFGMKTPTTNGPGVPIFTPYDHHGLGWRVDTVWESVFVRVVVKPAAVLAIAALIGLPIPSIMDRISEAASTM